MNWKIDHSPLPDYIRISVEGEPTLPDYQQLWADVINSELWRPGTGVLKDIRKRDPLGLEGFRIVQGIADYLTDEKDRVGDSLIAIIANREDGFRYGRVLEYAVRIRHSQMIIRTFRDEDTAVEWLNRNRPDQTPGAPSTSQ